MDDVEPTAAPEIPVAVAELELTPPAPPHRRRPLVAVTAFVALAALISGVTIAVSSTTPKQSVAAMLKAAPANTRDAGSASMTMHITMTLDGRTQLVSAITGATDFKTGNETLTLSGPGVDGEIRIVNHVEYVSNPMFELPNGAHWLRITKADLGMTAAAGVGSNDPSSGLDFLSGRAGNPTAVGTATIDGEKTTHYKLTIDFTTITSLLGKSSSKLGVPEMQQGLDALKGMLDLHHIPAEAWLDSAHRVRRFDYTLALSADGTNLVERASSEFSNFGEAVHVSAPSADDVVPFADAPDAFQNLMGIRSTPA